MATVLERTITLKLPEYPFRILQRAAELTYRTLDELVASAITASLVAPPDLPADLAAELEAMRFLSDDSLWAAARPSLSPAERERLEQLNHIGGERPLTEAEATEQAALLEAYHRSVLRRAQALAVLAQRGHPISPEDPALKVQDDGFPDLPSAA